MAFEFALPDLGEGVAEAEIERWLVEAGDEIAEDQPMVEVMTDKATVEIPSPAAGKVLDIKVSAGQVVAVGTVLVEIDAPEAQQASRRPVTEQRRDAATRSGTGDMTPAEAARRGAQVAAGTVPAAAPAANGSKVKATPLVRRIARELGVELAGIAGTGPAGKITEADVRGAAETSGTAAGAAVDAGALPPGIDEASIAERVPVKGMRRAIATHLTAASQVPTVTVVEECELTAVNAAREKSGHSFPAYLVAGVVAALQRHPVLNSIFMGTAEAGEVVTFAKFDLGIAVQADEGLVVPVLRDAGSLDLASIDAQVAGLAEAARSGSLTPDQTRGGTFTITSAGKLGGLFTTPLLNAPQVAILGLHRAEDRAVVRDGEVVVRSMANLSCTFDHRAVDGLEVSQFLLDLIAELQSA